MIANRMSLHIKDTVHVAQCARQQIKRVEHGLMLYMYTSQFCMDVAAVQCCRWFANGVLLNEKKIKT